MMGRSQRQKGARGEYLVRDLLRAHGFTAHRVPASGAAQGFKGDVEASHPDHGTSKFEVKLRGDNFKTVYLLYDNNKTSETLRVNIKGVMVTITRDPLKLFETERHFKEIYLLPRAENKIINLRKLLKDCDYLAVKDNNKPVLFLSFE
jgi:hypothetical protein